MKENSEVCELLWKNLKSMIHSYRYKALKSRSGIHKKYQRAFLKNCLNATYPFITSLEWQFCIQLMHGN